MLREKTPSPHTAKRRKNDPDDSQAHVHRRDTDSDAVLHLHTRVADCEASIDKLIESNRQMGDTLRQLTENLGRVAEVLEAWNNAKGFWLTLKLVSSGAKVVLPIMVMVGAIWAFIKTGQWVIDR